MDSAGSIDYRALKSRGMMRQRNGDFYSVRLAVTGGHLTSEQLQAIAELAARHGVGRVHLTTRQGVEILDVPHDQLEPLQRDLAAAGLSLGRAGPRVRGITACPGDICQHGLVDTQALARSVEAAVCSREGLPHKFKIGITGCPNGCAKPVENDLGIMGVAKGYRVFLGGRMGRKPRLGDRLPVEIASEETLLRVIHAAIDWYCAHADGRERFGATIDRLGAGSLFADLQRAAC